MYVANSEPATWRWGEGRAGMKERDLISGIIELTRSWTGYGEGVHLTQGSPPALVLRGVFFLSTIKLSRIGDPEAVQDRGWQIYRYYL